MIILIFFILFIFILYTYLGYPLILFILKIAKKGRVVSSGRGEYPTVSIVIPVYNEEAIIEEKLENTLALDYPRDKLEIVVASDGSTDHTLNLARTYSNRGVLIFNYPEHKGKMSVINRTVPKLSGDLVLFTDASAIFRNDAVSFLVSAFRPEIGAVSGALTLKEEAEKKGEVSVDLYWRLEKFLRRCESQVYSCVSATGAIYMLRRKLFQPLPEDTILDDMLIPLRPVRFGYRILFESRAKAYESGYTNTALEFRRKVRTLVGNYQTFFRAGWSILPWKSRIAFFMISHKLFRLLIPFALVGIFICSLFGPKILLPVLFLQLICYGLAGYGYLTNMKGRRLRKIFSVPMTFCLLNAAALRAMVVYFFQRENPVWK